MSGITLAPETLRIRTGSSEVNAAIHHGGDETSAPPSSFVLICDPLPLAGDASDDFTETVRDSLSDAGVTVAVYESHSRAAILDDFDAYTARQSLTEAVAVWNAALSTGAVGQSPALRTCILGIGIGALIASAVVRSIKTVNSLGIINPITTESLAGAQLRKALKAAGRSAIPKRFLQTIAELDTSIVRATHDQHVLCLAGANDALTNPADASSLASAARQAGWNARALLVAGGDHAFTEPDVRRTVVREFRAFVNAQHSD